jgi:hypothetical protein
MEHFGFGKQDWRRQAAAAMRAIPLDIAGSPSKMVINILGIPDALGEPLTPSARTPLDALDLPDVVFLTEARASSLLNCRLSKGFAAIVPVVAAARAGLAEQPVRADLTIGFLSRPRVEEALFVVEPMVERLRQVPVSVLNSDDPRKWLLARLHVRDRALAPRLDPASRLTVAFDDEAAIPGARVLAEELAGMGLLDRQFFDMLKICPHCASARLQAHEYCASCGSANLRETPILHHFSCAYQAPEPEFRTADGLACPKCRSRLRVFNMDYDRPGTICLCAACGHRSSDSTVGFVCIDCASRIRAEDVGTAPIHSYALTTAGRACVLDDAPLPAARDDDPIVRLRAFVQGRAPTRPWCVLRVHLIPPPGTAPGGRAWTQTCDFFGDVMRETFAECAEIVAAPPLFLALIDGDSRAEVEDALPEIRRRLGRHLALNPTIDIAVHGPAPAALRATGA